MHSIEQLNLTPSAMIRVLDHVTSRVSPDGSPKPMLAPFIWGAPGIGKTELVKAIATVRDSRCVAMHLPQYDPTDLKGIPVREDDGTIVWKTTSYLPQSATYTSGELAGVQSITLPWAYATDIALYVFNTDGEEIARRNDPTLPDLGDVEFRAAKSVDWKIEIGELPEDAHRITLVDKAIIFLDELSAADPATQNAALQLVLDRRVSEYDVPFGVPVLAAGNREDDGAFVQTLSHPLCNRFCHFTLIPGVDDWVEWAATSGVRSEIVGAIKADSSLLFMYNKEVRDTLANGRYGFATPRTWKMLSDQYLDWTGFLNLAGGNEREAARIRNAMFAGLIGHAAASKFVAYLEDTHDLPTPTDIAAGTAPDLGNIEQSKTFGLLYALIYKLHDLAMTKVDLDKPADQQSEEWTVPRDNIFSYITNNFSKEMGSWSYSMLSNKTAIKDLGLQYLRGEGFMKFSEKFITVYTKMGIKK